MSKKVVYTLILALAFIMVGVPVDSHAAAVSTPVSATSNPTRIACVGAAVDIREQAYSAGITAYMQAMTNAFKARGEALKQAYATKKGEELAEAARIAMDTFSSTVSTSRDQWMATRVAAAAQYQTAILLCPGGNPKPKPILFSDDFHRPDSSVIGNGWEKSSAGSSSSAEISNNMLLITGSNAGATDVEIMIATSTAVYIKTSFTSSMFSRGALRIGSRSKVNTYPYYGYGIVLNNEIANGNFEITDNGVPKASGTCNLIDNHNYWIELDYGPSGSVSAFCWDSTLSKPATPNTMFNTGSSYSSAANGSYYYLGWNQNSSTATTIAFKSFEIGSL